MTMSETQRLESLWAGEFGDEYVERNLAAYARRGAFWLPLLDEFPCEHVLEIGCNVGGNLQWIAQRVAPERIVGIDINEKALNLLSQRVAGVRTLLAPGRELPVADRSIDLAFTMGVLIHQPDESLPVFMDEMVRVSRRYVLCGEYFDDETVEVPYRGHEGALFRRDYGGMFAQRFSSELRLVRSGTLGRESGFDDVTWWLFERTT